MNWQPLQQAVSGSGSRLPAGAGSSGDDCGYTGGTAPNPSYAQVCTGITGHAEAVLIKYDPRIVSTRSCSPYSGGCTIPPHPTARVQTSAVNIALLYSTTTRTRMAAEASPKEYDRSGAYTDKAVTQIVPTSAFYVAEEYHQDYFAKQGS